MSQRSGIVYMVFAIAMSFGHVSDGHVVAISTDIGRHRGEQIGIYCQVDGNLSLYLERGNKTVISCKSHRHCQTPQINGYSFDEKASNSTWRVFHINSSGDTDQAEWTCRDSTSYKSTTLELAPAEQGPTYAHLEDEKKIFVECGEIKSTGPVYLERLKNEIWIFVASCTQEGCVCNSKCSLDKETRRHKMFVFNVESATTPEGTGFRCGSGDSWGNITYVTYKGPQPAPTNNAGTSLSPEYSLLATLLLGFVCALYKLKGFLSKKRKPTFQSLSKSKSAHFESFQRPQKTTFPKPHSPMLALKKNHVC